MLFNCLSTWYKERLAQRSELGAAKPCSLYSDNFYTQVSLAQTIHYLMVCGLKSPTILFIFSHSERCSGPREARSVEASISGLLI